MEVNGKYQNCSESNTNFSDFLACKRKAVSLPVDDSKVSIFLCFPELNSKI